MKVDERTIAVYLTHSSKTAIAKTLGVSRTYLYKLEKDPDFQAALQEYKRQILNTAINRMQGGLDDAVSVLLTIINDENVSAQTRLNAVNTLLIQLREMMQTQEFAQRLDALEQTVSDSR